MTRSRTVILFFALAAVTVILFCTDIAVGASNIPLSDVLAVLFGGNVDNITRSIVVDIRLIKAIVALLSGAALAVSGLQMQTLFRNPLAGPYVLGVSSGAGLGVALVLLAGIPAYGMGNIGMVAFAAWMGAAAVLVAMGLMAQRVNNIMAVLILGMMVSSGVGAVVQILQYLSREDALKAFVVWTMGSLGDVTSQQLYIMIPAIVAGLVLSWLMAKQLNLLLLGEDYARSMGVRLHGVRAGLFLATTLMAGTVTAFCGPVGFIGMAMPHVARSLFATSNHRLLIPATMLTGASALCLCDIISKAYTLPVNAVAALMGIPVVIWAVLRNKTMDV